jgi:hypothetical protein
MFICVKIFIKSGKDLIFMKKPSFTTTIERELQEKFKAECAIKGVKMNEIIEAFMKGFINGKLVYTNNEIKVTDKEI